MNNHARRRFCLEVEVNQSRETFGPTNSLVSYDLLLQIMDTNFIQYTVGFLISGLKKVHFAPLSYEDNNSAHTTERAWGNLLDGATNTSILKTTELFHEKGLTPIKNCGYTNMKCIHYAVFIMNLLGKAHLISTLLLSLISFFYWNRSHLFSCTHWDHQLLL